MRWQGRIARQTIHYIEILAPQLSIEKYVYKSINLLEDSRNNKMQAQSKLGCYINTLLIFIWTIFLHDLMVCLQLLIHLYKLVFSYQNHVFITADIDWIHHFWKPLWLSCSRWRRSSLQFWIFSSSKNQEIGIFESAWKFEDMDLGDFYQFDDPIYSVALDMIISMPRTIYLEVPCCPCLSLTKFSQVTLILRN